MYLASTYWRGSLNIGEMRLFKTEKEAFEYVETLLRESDIRVGTDARPSEYHHLSRVYKLSASDPPKLLRRD